jgi:aerobic carbon-monoxide dehydrogenase medium subunit
MRTRSVDGERSIEARDFFSGALSTALRENELWTEVVVPKLSPQTGTCFLEMARRGGDFALMGGRARDDHLGSARALYRGATGLLQC